ncbi:MAG TPA: hypothetical protein VKA30_08570, partial [Actinomycetota bacterium]|nr:hypothetical protein [Actinomycetota bacterium]
PPADGLSERHNREVGAYQQPLSAAIGTFVTFLLAAGASAVLARDIGGWTTDFAERVAAQNRRAPHKYLLLTRSAREDGADPARIRRSLAVVGTVTFVVACGVLVLEAALLAINGVA